MRSARCHAATLRAVSATAHDAVPRSAHASGARGSARDRRDERFARGDEVVLSIRRDAGVEGTSRRVDVVRVRRRDAERQRADDATATGTRDVRRAAAPRRRPSRYSSAPRSAASAGSVPDAENAASSSWRRNCSASSATAVETPRRRSARANAPGRVKLSDSSRARSASALVYARRTSQASRDGAAVVDERDEPRRIG